MNKEERCIYITRQVEFAAAHRLYCEDLSESENWDVYGKCANQHGHGHNYVLEVTFRGSPSDQTGMLVHFNEMKRLLKEVVETPMDHHNLNQDVEAMSGIIPTSENLAFVIWNLIDKAIATMPFALHKIRLASTPRSWVEYWGPGTGNSTPIPSDKR
ncbi:MAG: 6-carboxytetrahydropterin synthase [Deltaproteobacteria bacterium]|nr:6-carboxytetrahydropterin synthase [Deltaproteobacteria bacterium]